MGDMEEIIQCPAPAKIPPPTYYQLMQRFAPVHHHNIEKEGAAAPDKKKAMMVVATKKKEMHRRRFPKRSMGQNHRADSACLVSDSTFHDKQNALRRHMA
jgi:hypothetical protein